MSNLRLILLVGAALLLVIIFGHSPMDELRKKRAEKAGQKLVEKIENANKKGKPGVAPPRPNVVGQSQPPTVRSNPYIQQQTAPAAPKDDYYPPAPKNPNIKIPLSSLPGANNQLLARQLYSNPNLITDDGKGLAFWGAKVYVYDNDGKLKPMPDGKYTMYDGRWTMTVRGGEQIIANSDYLSWRH